VISLSYFVFLLSALSACSLVVLLNIMYHCIYMFFFVVAILLSFFFLYHELVKFLVLTELCNLLSLAFSMVLKISFLLVFPVMYQLSTYRDVSVVFAPRLLCTANLVL
jgi:hypothetical protein